MENKKFDELLLMVSELHALNVTLSTELAALRALCRAMALQPAFNRDMLHLSATTLLDAAISEMPPTLQDRGTLEQAQIFLDSLIRIQNA
jgi:hypothetical protein